MATVSVKGLKHFIFEVSMDFRFRVNHRHGTDGRNETLYHHNTSVLGTHRPVRLAAGRRRNNGVNNASRYRGVGMPKYYVGSVGEVPYIGLLIIIIIIFFLYPR